MEDHTRKTVSENLWGTPGLEKIKLGRHKEVDTQRCGDDGPSGLSSYHPVCASRDQQVENLTIPGALASPVPAADAPSLCPGQAFPFVSAPPLTPLTLEEPEPQQLLQSQYVPYLTPNRVSSWPFYQLVLSSHLETPCLSKPS